MGKSNVLSFEQMWEQVAEARNGESISAELRPLLQHVYETIGDQSPDFQEVKGSLENLLTFLCSESGRTSGNCVVTDSFFALEDWGINSKGFPDALTDIMSDMGSTLHDTVSHPEIARNFDSLPEQLLKRVQQWQPKNE